MCVFRNSQGCCTRHCSHRSLWRDDELCFVTGGVQLRASMELFSIKTALVFVWWDISLDWVSGGCSLLLCAAKNLERARQLKMALIVFADLIWKLSQAFLFFQVDLKKYAWIYFKWNSVNMEIIFIFLQINLILFKWGKMCPKSFIFSFICCFFPKDSGN